MDNEQQTPTRKVIPPTSLVAIICLAVGLVIGYLFGGKYELSTNEGIQGVYKINKHTGETWFTSPALGRKWERVSE